MKELFESFNFVRLRVVDKRLYYDFRGRVIDFRIKNDVKMFSEIDSTFGFELELRGSQKAIDGFTEDMKNLFGNSAIYKIR